MSRDYCIFFSPVQSGPGTLLVGEISFIYYFILDLSCPFFPEKFLSRPRLNCIEASAVVAAVSVCSK